MQPKKISEDSKAIQNRCLDVLRKCIDDKKVEGLAVFCREHKLNRSKYVDLYASIRNPLRDPKYKLIDIELIAYLVKDFGVSPEWLLFGKGEVFKK